MQSSGVPYRHTGAALLRAAATALPDLPAGWPDPEDAHACSTWLDEIWASPRVAEAVGQASPSLAGRVEAMRAGHPMRSKDVRRAALATARYVLRGSGRPTPFGLFAGVAPVALGRAYAVRWGDGHRVAVRADTQWLSEVIDRLEAMPLLLDRLDVVMTNLAVRRGRWLEAPCGPGRVRLSYTAPLDAVRQTAESPIRLGVLADKLAASFGSERATAAAMLGELVRLRLLITNLRAPFTNVDPLGYLIDQLHSAGVEDLPEAAALTAVLEEIQRSIRDSVGSSVTTSSLRTDLTATMRRVAATTRSPLAVDLHLDCDVQVPEQIAAEAAQAAGALLRLAREPEGSMGWRSYHRAFVDRYGTGTLVPVTEAVSDTGIGFPPGFPGSRLPDAADPPSLRDRRLLGLAWQAVVDGDRELVVTDELLEELAGPLPLDASTPPHVEVAARVHAPSGQALADGDYLLVISPARAAGVMTSRFTVTATGAGLTEVYGRLPTTAAGALPVQMSFGGAYPYADNIARVPAYLPVVLPLGEHRSDKDNVEVLELDDVAITATTGRLHLVSLSRRLVMEPLVFHALDLTKQAPPVARFLARLTRGFGHGWTSFDWGPHAAELPYLPRVRYGRAVLSPARWRLTIADLPRASGPERRQALATWRRRSGCPSVVELREEDRTLRVDLEEPLHAAILHAQLTRYGDALLTEAPDSAAFGWIDGHAHEIAIPLVSTRPAAPSLMTGTLPVLSNTDSSQLPAGPNGRWLYARLHAHRERHDEIITAHLPDLTAALGGAEMWFIRYHNPEQPDHLRLRIRLTNPAEFGPYATAVGSWAQRLREMGLSEHLLFDTYTPEVGRYGGIDALSAAEDVFIADSRLVIAELRHLADQLDPLVLTAASMVGLLVDFFDLGTAMRWLIERPAAGPAAERPVAHAATELALRVSESAAEWPPGVAEAWDARTAALHTYRAALPPEIDVDTVAESLLHMHHNRVRGIDRDGEATCRRLARQAAVAWHARRPRTAP